MNYVKFGDYDSFEDFGLILTEFSIGFPSAKRYTVDIPGRDGALDVTSALYDEPVYENRTHKATFRARRGRQYRADALSDLMAKVHGRTLNVVVYNDTDWYWRAHCEVSELSLNRVSGDITINIDAEPYKHAVSETVYEITGSQTVTLTNGRMTVIPTVTVTDETTITIDDSSVSLSEGTYEMTDFPLYEGDTTWEIETDGTVTITYRQGRL